MMKRNVSKRFLSMVAALAMGFACAQASADTITCTSVCNFGPGDVLDNLNVKNGGVATLDGTLVTGNIVVEDGGKLFLKNGVEVEGNVQSFGASHTSVKDTTVGGSVQIKNTPKILVTTSTIEGDLQLEENNATLPETKITWNVIGGNLQLYKNKFTNRQARIIANDVYGNLQLVDNQTGTIVVKNNYVESALQCSDNDAVITGSGNDAGDLECPQLQ
jgi:hypothetical protein